MNFVKLSALFLAFMTISQATSAAKEMSVACPQLQEIKLKDPIAEANNGYWAGSFSVQKPPSLKVEAIDPGQTSQLRCKYTGSSTTGELRLLKWPEAYPSCIATNENAFIGFVCK